MNLDLFYELVWQLPIESIQNGNFTVAKPTKTNAFSCHPTGTYGHVYKAKRKDG